MTKTLHAVVTDDRLTTWMGGRVKLSRPVRHIAELELLGQRTGITHFWIMPNSHVDSLGHEFLTDKDGYNIFQTKNQDGSLYTTPHAARCRKIGSVGNEILVCYPYRGGFGWTIRDPQDISTAIYYLSTTLKVPVQWSPAHMSLTLLKESLKLRPDWLKKSDVSLDDIPFTTAAKDIRFIQPLTFDMVGSYLHEYDKNSAYLSACQSVTVGSGTPIHLMEDELYKGGYIEKPVQSGIYNVRAIHRTSSCKWDEGKLPPIIRKEGWVTADILEYAIVNGYEVHVSEGWVFPESHQLLRKWAATLWDTRVLLNPKNPSDIFPNMQGRINAYTTIKAMATQGLGKLGMRGVQHEMSHPNWWCDAVGKNRMAVLYNIKKFADAGYFPQFVKCDAIWYVLPPNTDVPGILDRSDKLGGFKHEYSLLLTREIVQESQQYKGDALLEFLAGCVKKVAGN